MDMQESGVDKVVTESRLALTEARFDARMDMLSARVVRIEHTMATKDDLHALETRLESKIDRIYLIMLESVERSRRFEDKFLSHGDILISHEARIRGLEGRA